VFSGTFYALILGVSQLIDWRWRSLSNRNIGKFPLVKKVLAGRWLVIFGVYPLSESAFIRTILSVALLALVAFFKETLSRAMRSRVAATNGSFGSATS
jgi:hypothetical protein